MSEGAAHRVADGDDRARRYFRVAHTCVVWSRRFDSLANRVAVATPMIGSSSFARKPLTAVAAPSFPNNRWG